MSGEDSVYVYTSRWLVMHTLVLCSSYVQGVNKEGGSDVYLGVYVGYV